MPSGKSSYLNCKPALGLQVVCRLPPHSPHIDACLLPEIGIGSEEINSRNAAPSRKHPQIWKAGCHKWPNDNIGNPKLFMGGKASGANLRPPPTVNNFVAATSAVTDSGWPLIVISCIQLRFSRPGGPGLLTSGRYNNFPSAIASQRRRMSLLTGPSGGA